MAKESLLVRGTDFAAAEVGDTLVYRPKSTRCGLGLGTQFTLLALIAATGSLLQHPPSLMPDWSNVEHSGESSRTGAAPLLFGILGSSIFTHMHRVLRRFCVRNPGVLRRAQLFCDGCASTCWLLGCAAAETACGTYRRAGSGRTFAEIYAASAYPSQQSLNGSNASAEGPLELWTVVELIEHGLGGVTADIAAPGEHQPVAGGMGAASCNGPMVALTNSDFEGVSNDHKEQRGSNDTTGWAILLPLLVPSVLLPLLFAAVRCDAFSGTETGSAPAAGRHRSTGIVQWCKRRGPSGLPRGVVVRSSIHIVVPDSKGGLSNLPPIGTTAVHLSSGRRVPAAFCCGNAGSTDLGISPPQGKHTLRHAHIKRPDV
jgi:hypothetical protein